jgi:VanZ family protein
VNLSLRHPVIAWSLLAGYCLLIFIQSSLPSPALGPDLPWQDKFAHLAAYAMMGFLACRAWATARCVRGTFGVFVAGFLFAVLFGLTDEWHQSFVPARMSDGWDLVADGLGALLGAGFYVWRCRRADTPEK